jgi:hypothetical protein
VLYLCPNIRGVQRRMRIKPAKEDLLLVYKNIDFEKLLNSYAQKIEDLRRCL